MPNNSLVLTFQQARRDDSLVILEGLHTLKHALRFGGEILYSVSPDKAKLLKLSEQLAPDILGQLGGLIQQVDIKIYNQLAPIPPRSGVISIARRPSYKLSDALKSHKSIVLLDDPRDHQNVGAVIRVSAAADIAAVLTTGQLNPWMPSVLRGSAGLHFALPVIRVTPSQIIESDCRLIGLDERGELLQDITLQGQTKAVLIFGSERAGISPELRKNLAQIVRIPMRSGVSSLNLATSVAITLYTGLGVSQ